MSSDRLSLQVEQSRPTFDLTARPSAATSISSLSVGKTFGPSELHRGGVAFNSRVGDQSSTSIIILPCIRITLVPRTRTQSQVSETRADYCCFPAAAVYGRHMGADFTRLSHKIPKPSSQNGDASASPIHPLQPRSLRAGPVRLRPLAFLGSLSTNQTLPQPGLCT